MTNTGWMELSLSASSNIFSVVLLWRLDPFSGVDDEGIGASFHENG